MIEIKEGIKMIKEQSLLVNKYIDMGSMPNEFKLGISLMARDLNREITKLTLIRSKEYAEYIKNKSDLIRLTGELEEALEYWQKRIKKQGERR